MTKALMEAPGCSIHQSDIVSYPNVAGPCETLDFSLDLLAHRRVDWIVTNPPYKLAREFFQLGFTRTTKGLALLTRLNWLQNGKRHLEIFGPYPPQLLIFAGRIPVKQGGVVQKASVFFQHCWVVWEHGVSAGPPVWIPEAAQRELEKDEDYA